MSDRIIMPPPLLEAAFNGSITRRWEQLLAKRPSIRGKIRIRMQMWYL
jgi:hypothetical protein